MRISTNNARLIRRGIKLAKERVWIVSVSHRDARGEWLWRAGLHDELARPLDKLARHAYDRSLTHLDMPIEWWKLYRSGVRCALEYGENAIFQRFPW